MDGRGTHRFPVTDRFGYEMKEREGTVVCIGTSQHAFLNQEGKPVRMKQDYPELFETIKDLIREES